MHWMWGYLATGAVVVGLMIWHANSTQRRFYKQVDAHLEAARSECSLPNEHAAVIEREAA